MQFITKNFQETQKLAGKIIKMLVDRAHHGALILALQGELGAGKTTFVQGLAKALGVKEKILSPTFIIMKHFNILTLKHFSDFYHLDCYRIENANDLDALGFKEILKNKNNLVVIEWAERVADVLSADVVWMRFEHGGGDERKIKILNSNL